MIMSDVSNKKMHMVVNKNFIVFKNIVAEKIMIMKHMLDKISKKQKYQQHKYNKKYKTP